MSISKIKISVQNPIGFFTVDDKSKEKEVVKDEALQAILKYIQKLESETAAGDDVKISDMIVDGYREWTLADPVSIKEIMEIMDDEE